MTLKKINSKESEESTNTWTPLKPKNALGEKTISPNCKEEDKKLLKLLRPQNIHKNVYKSFWYKILKWLSIYSLNILKHITLKGTE